MGSRQVLSPAESHASPPEDAESRDPGEAAAAARAAPATGLPTLQPPTLEEPPPPPAAAGEPLVRARTGPLLPPSTGPAAHAQSPPSRDPPPSDTRRAPESSSLPSPRGAREADGAGSHRSGAGRSAVASLAPPPAPLLIGCCEDPPPHSPPLTRARALGAAALDPRRSGRAEWPWALKTELEGPPRPRTGEQRVPDFLRRFLR
ncbi:unnamed protein product [Pipistrellus nathusii]|uniref:Uncharacterized protein n=1 Tax=Pipistrellus nathusii TaxID=59473 RepID=A0ABN9ZYQ8_PIPNA